jgi:threonine dehydratase
MEVPKKERAEVRKYLDELGYAWFEETNNPAYQLFLG